MCAVCLGVVCVCVRFQLCVLSLCIRALESLCFCVRTCFLFFFPSSEFCEVVAGVYSNENACFSFSPLFSH